MYSLSLRVKLIFIVVGAICLLALCYHYSISETIVLRGQIAGKQDEIDWINEKSRILPMIEAKLQVYSKVNNSGNKSSRDILAHYLSIKAEKFKCVVTDIPLQEEYQIADGSVKINSFTLQGNFEELLQVLHSLEEDRSAGAIVISARFFSSEDRERKRQVLSITIITRSIEQRA